MRRCASSPLREFELAEQEQRDKEAAVDARKVVFASGISSDNRPRVAASEAFDVAMSALPRPPNFCCVNITLDYSAMMDAPEVVYFQLCRANGVTPSTVTPGQLALMGGAVSHQRVGGSGFIQVLLGCIPDLSVDLFTFDALPSASFIADASLPKPFLCVASLDAKLSLQHEALLGSHLRNLKRDLGTTPLTGGVYPPLGMPQHSSSPQERRATVRNDELEDSLFFFNDRVYRGSAAAALLRSNMVKAHVVNITPSICLKSNISVVSFERNGSTLILHTLSVDGKAAVPSTDVIREAYTQETSLNPSSKIFLGLRSPQNSDVLPVSFTGNQASGSIRCEIPEFLSVEEGTKLELLVDDPELDMEAAAGQLISLQKKMTITSATKDVMVAREGRKKIVTSSAAGLHFSHRFMNVNARRDDMLTLGLGNSANVISAPSVLQRCIGDTVANAGIYCPGQVVTVAGSAMIAARASSYCVLEGLE